MGSSEADSHDNNPKNNTDLDQTTYTTLCLEPLAKCSVLAFAKTVALLCLPHFWMGNNVAMRQPQRVKLTTGWSDVTKLREVSVRS